MDQDSTKDQAAGGDRRNWRERLGVGQDLPKISDEFKQDHKPAEGESQPAASRPGTPVRPAPMAPRYSRSTPSQPTNGSASGTEAQKTEPTDAPGTTAQTSGVKPWAPSQPASEQTSARSDYAPPTPPLPEAQRQAPSRGPAAYPQAAARPGADSAPSRNDSFGERLRAQREAAEKLAQQRLAAARDRSGQASADSLAMLTPRRSEDAPHAPEPKAQPKPAGGEQPRFTFAQEEIAAAQQETIFAPAAAPGGTPQQAPAAPRQSAPQPETSAPNLHAPDDAAVARTPEQVPEYQPDYRHEDDGMFEDDQPGLHVEAPRASAADYSAAYREFEDEFEDDEPRRGKGPLLLLASLAAVAVISGGLIYGYQQMEGPSPVAEPVNLPVVAAPEEPAKSEPVAEEQPEQAAVQPTTRKEIYDRIIGEETLEPERIVPTEEEPLRQIQQPRASGDGGSESAEPLPMPLPPPPGTGIGEQGDLLVPGMAATQTALAPPEPAQLSLPEPGTTTAALGEPADAPMSRTAEARPEPAEAAPADAAPAINAAEELRRAKAAPEPDVEAPVRASIYPELTEPLAYPTVRAEGPETATPHDSVAAPEEAQIALPEPQAPAPQAPAPRAEEPVEEMAEADPQIEAEVETLAVAEPDPAAETIPDVPLPKAKPEPPVRTAAAPAPEPQAQAQAQAQPEPQPSSGGPVQIIPTDEGTSQPLPPSTRAAQQPETQAPPRRRVGREPDPFAGPNGNSLSALRTASNAAPQQMASVDASTSQAQPAQSSGGGYVVQLASFRSEAEALKEYRRLSQRHPQLVGNLGSRVQEASLGQSGSFYRLGVGPLGDRSAATKLCNALIAAGEKDCLVRRN